MPKLMLSQRALKILWLAPFANVVVGGLDLAAGMRAVGVANLVCAVVAVLAIKWLENDAKIDISAHQPTDDAITPQDREFRWIHEQL